MNTIQTLFLEILKEYPDGLTLSEISKKINQPVKTGNVMSLVRNGLVRKTEHTNIYKLTENVKPTETEIFRNTAIEVENHYKTHSIYDDLLRRNH